jgi:hypothetical protein
MKYTGYAGRSSLFDMCRGLPDDASDSREEEVRTWRSLAVE